MTLSRRKRVRRVTVCVRNASHSVRMSRRPFWRGRPSVPMQTRLTEALLSMLVCASSVLTNSSRSTREVLGSNTRRTAASLPDSSRTASSRFSMTALDWVCSGVRLFLPVLTWDW